VDIKYRHRSCQAPERNRRTKPLGYGDCIRNSPEEILVGRVERMLITGVEGKSPRHLQSLERIWEQIFVLRNTRLPLVGKGTILGTDVFMRKVRFMVRE